MGIRGEIDDGCIKLFEPCGIGGRNGLVGNRESAVLDADDAGGEGQWKGCGRRLRRCRGRGWLADSLGCGFRCLRGFGWWSNSEETQEVYTAILFERHDCLRIDQTDFVALERQRFRLQREADEFEL